MVSHNREHTTVPKIRITSLGIFSIIRATLAIQSPNTTRKKLKRVCIRFSKNTRSWFTSHFSASDVLFIWGNVAITVGSLPNDSIQRPDYFPRAGPVGHRSFVVFVVRNWSWL